MAVLLATFATGDFREKENDGGQDLAAILPRERTQVMKTARRALKNKHLEKYYQDNEENYSKRIPKIKIIQNMNCDLALVQRYFAFNGRQTATNLKTKNSVVLPFYNRGIDVSMFDMSIVQGVFLLVPKSHACVFGLKLNWFPITDKGKDLGNQFSLNPNTQKCLLGTSQKNTLYIVSQ